MEHFCYNKNCKLHRYSDKHHTIVLDNHNRLCGFKIDEPIHPPDKCSRVLHHRLKFITYDNKCEYYCNVCAGIRDSIQEMHYESIFETMSIKDKQIDELKNQNNDLKIQIENFNKYLTRVCKIAINKET